MAVTFIRTLIVYLTLIIIMRLMGKRQIGEMQPFEFVVTLIIADLACIPLADVSIPLLYGVVSILTLFILHQVFSLADGQGKLFKRIISGKPSLVINKQGVDLLELKRNNLNVKDLIESLRSTGCFSLDGVDYAVYEANGKLSTLQKQGSDNALPSPSCLPLILVSDGKPDKQNLKLINLEQSSVVNFLSKHDSSIKKTEVLTVDGDGRAYLKTKGEKYKILHFSLPWGAKW